MSFFTEVDSSLIIERHIRKVAGLEITQQRILLKKYNIAIEEISNRLLAVNPGTYTEAQLKVILVQLEQGVAVLQSGIGKEILIGTDMATENGMEDSVKEVNFFEKKFNNVQRAIPVDLILASAERDNFLFNQYRSSIRAFNEGFRNKMQGRLTQGLIQKKPLFVVINEIAADFKGDQWKIARIVRTEMHNIYNVAKLRTFSDIKKKVLKDLKKTLIHPIDGRTGRDSVIAAAKNLIVEIDKPFRYSFKQGSKIIKREFMAPPDRPNDRAILVPYRNSYDKKEK